MEYDLTKLDHKKSGTGIPILLLHGWGTNKDTFDSLIASIEKNLGKKVQAFSFTFPGFGNSPEPDQPWELNDFVELTQRYLNSFVAEWDNSNLIVIAHSFGGRVVARLAANPNTPNFKKIILMGSAGIKPDRGALYYLKVYTFKAIKLISKIPLIKEILMRPMEAYQKIYGSKDYSNASPIMRTTLSKIVNEDLSQDFSKIKTPSLLIWGKNDNSTPIEDAKKIEKLMEGAALIEVESAGHFVYLHQNLKVADIISRFIGGING